MGCVNTRPVTTSTGLRFGAAGRVLLLVGGLRSSPARVVAARSSARPLAVPARRPQLPSPPPLPPSPAATTSSLIHPRYGQEIRCRCATHDFRPSWPFAAPGACQSLRYHSGRSCRPRRGRPTLNWACGPSHAAPTLVSPREPSARHRWGRTTAIEVREGFVLGAPAARGATLPTSGSGGSGEVRPTHRKGPPPRHWRTRPIPGRLAARGDLARDGAGSHPAGAVRAIAAGVAESVR